MGHNLSRTEATGSKRLEGRNHALLPQPDPSCH